MNETERSYGYATGDPVNVIDPLGLLGIPGTHIHVNVPSPGDVLHATERAVSAGYDLTLGVSSSAVSTVVNGALYLSQTAYANADKIAVVSATLALLPGPQQPFFVAIAAVASAVAAGQDIHNNNYLRAGVDLTGAFAGAGAFALARLAPRLDALAEAISSNDLAAIADYASRVARIDQRRAYRLLAESFAYNARTGDLLAASSAYASFDFFPSSAAECLTG